MVAMFLALPFGVHMKLPSPSRNPASQQMSLTATTFHLQPFNIV